MNIKESFIEISKKLDEMGVPVAKDPVVTVNEIIEISNELDIITIEDLLNRLTAYNIYLKSQRGSYEAQLIIKEGELKRLLYLETQSLPKESPQGSFFSKEEKESLILSSKLQNLHEEVLKLKAIVARIRDIPFAIDKKIDLLKMRYRRLASDQYRKESGN